MDRREQLQAEFERAAEGFASRTRGRFDDLGAPEFARFSDGESVLEVGCGTGNFLSLFAGRAGILIGVDVTFGMLRRAYMEHPDVLPVQADGARLPLGSRSIDLVASAQALHHIHRPVPVVKEMARVARAGGRVLIVDQLAPESYEQAAFMTQLDTIRDPSHAVSRPRSAFHIVVRSAGLEIIDEKVHESRSRLSNWMWPGEFPEERMAAVVDFIQRFGHETGMDFVREGDDWTFTRRRIMLLARRAA